MRLGMCGESLEMRLGMCGESLGTRLVVCESGNEASLRTVHKGCVLLSLSLHVPIKRTLAHFHKYS